MNDAQIVLLQYLNFSHSFRKNPQEIFAVLLHNSAGNSCELQPEVPITPQTRCRAKMPDFVPGETVCLNHTFK